MLRPPPPPGPDSTERSAPRALCGADAAGARGRGHARPRPSPSGLHTHTQIHTHILTNPEAAFAGWSPGAPPPSWRVRTVSPRRAPQLDSKRIWPANVCARLGAALSGKVRGTCLLQGQERLWWHEKKGASGMADSKGRLSITQLSKGHPQPPTPPLNHLLGP